MKNATEIMCIIDKSGSMSPRKADAIGGFNSFIEEQKKLPDDAYLTLVLFDTEVNTVHESVNIKSVPPLDDKTYSPSGCTALLDAVGDGIDRLGARLSSLNENDRPDKVLVVILTDGEENSSHKFTKQQIKDKIELQSGTYKWEFVYLGANQNSFAEASSIGIAMANAFSVDTNTSKGVYDAYSDMSLYTTNYRNTGSIN